MEYYIGIDLGTSACKFLLVDETGRLCNTVVREYALRFPHPGWSEQNPADWWQAVCLGVPELISGIDARYVRGIGAAGQMHGLVALDKNGAVIRPCILWNDGRTRAETDYLNHTIGREFLSAHTGNIAFAGFTAPKLLWLKRSEPENFSRIASILLPKDYVNFRLTGRLSTDYSDASGTLLLDVEHKCWSEEMCRLCGVSASWLPVLHESWETIGTVLPDVAAQLGLPEDVRVCAGAGDNAAAALGTGTAGRGHCNITLGTSGTVFISSEKFGVDASNSLHAFAHADGGWHLMGCMLSAASCNKWWMDNILKTADYNAEQAGILPEKLGENRVFFLPYLMGERSPINDTNARGTLIGLSMDSTRADVTQAVLEGVAFALRDSVEAAKNIGAAVPRSCLCGGGSKSPLWRTILAGVLGIPLDLPATEQGPGYGSALLAMVACERYPTIQAAVRKLVTIKETVRPDPALCAKYEAQYRKFRRIYPACRPLFASLAEQ